MKASYVTENHIVLSLVVPASSCVTYMRKAWPSGASIFFITHTTAMLELFEMYKMAVENQNPLSWTLGIVKLHRLTSWSRRMRQCLLKNMHFFKFASHEKEMHLSECTPTRQKAPHNWSQAIFSSETYPQH